MRKLKSSEVIQFVFSQKDNWAADHGPKYQSPSDLFFLATPY